MLISVIFNTAGQFFAKSGALKLETQSFEKLFQSFVFNPALWGAIMCYASSLVVWVYTLSKLPLCLAASLFSISYIATALLGFLVFNEMFSLQGLLGTLLIAGGIYLVASCA